MGRDCAWGGQVDKVYTLCIIPTEPAALPPSADAHGWALSGQVKDGISTVLGSLAAGWGVQWGVVCNGVGESKCRWLSGWERKGSGQEGLLKTERGRRRSVTWQLNQQDEVKDLTSRLHWGQTYYSWCLSWWVEVLAEPVFSMLPIIARRIQEEGSQGKNMTS